MQLTDRGIIRAGLFDPNLHLQAIKLTALFNKSLRDFEWGSVHAAGKSARKLEMKSWNMISFQRKMKKKNSSTALAAGANGRGARVPGFLDRPGRLRTSRARDGRSARLYIRLMRRWWVYLHRISSLDSSLFVSAWSSVFDFSSSSCLCNCASLLAGNKQKNGGQHGDLHRHHPRHHPAAARRLLQVRLRGKPPLSTVFALGLLWSFHAACLLLSLCVVNRLWWLICRLSSGSACCSPSSATSPASSTLSGSSPSRRRITTLPR